MAEKSATSAADKDDLIRALFENSSDLMHVVGADGRFKLVNPAWTRLTGWTESELIGARALDFVVSDSMDSTTSRLAAIAVGEVSESQNQIRAKDGRLFWVAIRTQLMAGGDFIVTLRDAAAERARDEELEDARRTRKVLGASAGLGLWEYDPQADTIWWSDELADLIGFDPEITWTPDVFFERVHPRDRKRTRDVMTEAVTSGTPVQTEHRVLARDR